MVRARKLKLQPNINLILYILNKKIKKLSICIIGLKFSQCKKKCQRNETCQGIEFACKGSVTDEATPYSFKNDWLFTFKVNGKW